MQRVEESTGPVMYRRSTVRKRLFGHDRGFVCVNGGADFASQLARYLSDLDSSAFPRGAGSARSGAGASVERSTGRTTEAPLASDGPPAAP